MTEQDKSFYQPEARLQTRTLEEWADYISSEHYYRNPDVYSHRGEVVSFFANTNLRGFWLRLKDAPPDCTELACVSTRYMSNEKYMAIERYARMAVDFNVDIVIEGVLGYDWTGAQITQVERVWLGDDSQLVFQLGKGLVEERNEQIV